jgi:hypothetical protein
MFKACQLHGVSHCHIQLILLTYGCRIKRGFHRPIMAEGYVLLGMGQMGHQQDQRDKTETFHLIITQKIAVLLYND